MNIGIDIDGVLADLERYILDCGTKFNVEEGIKTKLKLNEYWESQKFGWTDEQEEKFWNRYLEKYVKEFPTRGYASEVIQKLKDEGNKIYIITARNESGLPPESYGKMQEMTKKWLVENNINYDEIIFAKDNEKLEQCLKNNIDVMIEDSPTNINSICQKIPVIKYDCQYNKDVNGENVITAYTWYHIYEIIKNEF